MRETIKSLRAYEFTRPLFTSFATSLGKKDRMRSVIVELTLSGGEKGNAEIPTSFAVPYETIERIFAVISAEKEHIKGRDPADHAGIARYLRKKYPGMPMTASGIETAVFRAHLAAAGITELKWWGGKGKKIETDITIPFSADSEIIKKWLIKFIRKGFGTYKLKVSGNIAADRRLIDLVYGILGEKLEKFTVRLDGNQGFTVPSYGEIVKHIQKKKHRVELFEQPLKKDDHKGLKKAAGEYPIPVVLDETVFTPEEAVKAAAGGLGHAINVKLAKSGISGTKEIMKIARENGMKLMAGCMTEGMVGLSSGIYAAMGSGEFDYIDLDGIHFMEHAPFWNDISIEGPYFKIRKRRA
jgi:L-alanine-DL-glutamate epimerase-like enolase superfamily enzyme